MNITYFVPIKTEIGLFENSVKTELIYIEAATLSEAHIKYSCITEGIPTNHGVHNRDLKSTDRTNYGNIIEKEQFLKEHKHNIESMSIGPFMIYRKK